MTQADLIKNYFATFHSAQVNGHEAVTLLFSSGAYNMFHASSIAIFGVVFFVLTAVTTSLSLPAGIFVPSMCIGACVGRLLAIFTNTYVKIPLGLTPIDPGPWATIGAAAFMCGSARITVTIAIIILEITGDFRYIPGIAIAVVFAKMTGGFFTKSALGGEGGYHHSADVLAGPKLVFDLRANYSQLFFPILIPFPHLPLLSRSLSLSFSLLLSLSLSLFLSFFLAFFLFIACSLSFFQVSIT